jgi:formylglycine-generating enzyme required for sulfatase activity
MATATKKKCEKVAEVTLSQQAAASETSRQLAKDEKLLDAPRKKKTLIVAVAAGLLGLIGIVSVYLSITIHVRHPDGSETVMRVPDGSVVSVTKDSDSRSAVKQASYGPGAPPLAIAPFDAAKAKQCQKAWAKHLGVSVEETNSIGMKLALISPGEFEMGSTDEEIARLLEKGKKNREPKWYLDAIPTEAPRHRVRITKPFYLGMYQVTQGEYAQVTGMNPSAFTEKQMDGSTFNPPLPEQEVTLRADDRKKVVGADTSRHPVETVDWEEAMEFCRRLSTMPAERAARRVYRLPTEAEWEYACRAGTTTRWYSGDDEEELADLAWFRKNAGGMTHPVGQKYPNAWGLYDMCGNAEQWCADRFSTDYYKRSPQDAPPGPAGGHLRMLRGGVWDTLASACRSASRNSYGPDSHSHNFGFRVVVEVVAKEQEQPTTPAAMSTSGVSNAPPPAIAPFDATQAKQHQEP